MSTTKSTGDLPFETALVFERRWTLVLLNRTFAMLRFEHKFVGKLLRVASLASALTLKAAALQRWKSTE
jgi:hypothetical protein